MTSVDFGFIAGVIVTLLVYFFIPVIFSGARFKDNDFIPHKSKILYEIRQCEKESPRNQECEIMMSAVPKQEEK